VRETEDFFLIEVPDNVRKIVIVKAQVHGVMTYITPSCIKNETHVREAEGIFKIEVSDNVILVSNNRKSL
jgi:hypothetical protein